MQRVVVVGGGVLGMMHAAAARHRGYQVVQLEREAGSRGATARNFGLVWVSGRPPARSWSSHCAPGSSGRSWRRSCPARASGRTDSLTLAAHDAEAALLREAACLPDACQRGYQFLDPAAVRAVNPALRGAFSCGLLCSRDAIVEPRQVPVAIRDYLLARCTGAGYAWLPGRDAVEIAPGAVRDHSGTWHRGPGQARAAASGRRGRRRAAAAGTAA